MVSGKEREGEGRRGKEREGEGRRGKEREGEGRRGVCGVENSEMVRNMERKV